MADTNTPRRCHPALPVTYQPYPPDGLLEMGLPQAPDYSWCSLIYRLQYTVGPLRQQILCQCSAQLLGLCYRTADLMTDNFATINRPH